MLALSWEKGELGSTGFISSVSVSSSSCMSLAILFWAFFVRQLRKLQKHFAEDSRVGSLDSNLSNKTHTTQGVQPGGRICT